MGYTLYHTPQLLFDANRQIEKMENNSTLKNVMCLHMLKHCEFEKYMKIYAIANCKQIRSMKGQNIANLYQKQKYAKYELCKKICTFSLPCKSQTVTGKFGSTQIGTIHFGNRTN